MNLKEMMFFNILSAVESGSFTGAQYEVYRKIKSMTVKELFGYIKFLEINLVRAVEGKKIEDMTEEDLVSLEKRIEEIRAIKKKPQSDLQGLAEFVSLY